MIRFAYLTLTILLLAAANANARPIRVTSTITNVESTNCPGGVCTKASSTTNKTVVRGADAVTITQPAAKANAPTTKEPPTADALDEVNRQRAARGLPPFIRDPHLTAGAIQIAAHRARFSIRGHSVNDFSALPIGTSAACAGCAAWSAGSEFGACGLYENRYRYAGAASVTSGGIRFTHIFYR